MLVTNLKCFRNFRMILTLVVAGLVCFTDGTFVEEEDELSRFVEKHTRDKRHEDEPFVEDEGLLAVGPEQLIPSSYKALPFYYLAGLLGFTIIAMCCTCAYIQYRFNEDALYRFIIERIKIRKAIRGLEQPIQSYGGGYELRDDPRLSSNYSEPIRRTGLLSKRSTGSRVSSPSHNSLESLRSSEYCSIYENPNFVYGDEDDVNHGYGVNPASTRTSAVSRDQSESSQSGSASVTGRLRNAYQNARKLHDSISAKIRQLMSKRESLEENEQLLVASLEHRNRNRPERVQRNKIRELMNKDKQRRSLSDLISGRFASSTESLSKLDNLVDYDDVDRENSFVNGTEMTPPGGGNDRLLLHRSNSRTKSKRHLSRSRSKSKSLRKSHSKSKSHSRRTKHQNHHSGSGRSRSKRKVPIDLDIVSVPIRKVNDYREEPPAKFNQLPPDLEQMNDNSQSKQTMETFPNPPIEVMPVDPMENTPTQPLPPLTPLTPPPTPPPTPPIAQLPVGFPQTMLPNEQITIPAHNNNINNINNNNGNFETEQ